MKAAQINEYGGKDVVKTVGDVPRPKAGKGQILVAVKSAGVNPFDWKIREGFARQKVELKFPATLGGDLAGTVTELGEGVSEFSAGDEVYGQAGSLSGNGSFAEFTPINAGAVAHKPKSVDFTDAAALPLAGTSAYQALVDLAGVQKGQRVLIHGGAGGLGSFSVQLAKHLGAYAATTVSAKDAGFAQNLGADEVIEYNSQDFSDILAGYDVVYDLVGGEVAEKSFLVLKKGGVLVSMFEESNKELEQKYAVKFIKMSSQVTRDRLEKLAELVDSGAIKTHIDKVFPLDQAAEALDYQQNSKPRGKVVIKVY